MNSKRLFADSDDANKFSVEVCDCLNPLSSDEWTYLFHNSANTVAMAELLDLYGLGGFKLRSIVVRLSGKPILLLPLFETIHDIAAMLEGRPKILVGWLGKIVPWFVRMKFMRVGVVDQQCGQIGFDPSISKNDLSKAWDMALNELDKLCKSLHIQLIAFTEYTSETGHMLPINKLSDYCTASGAPFCQMKISFDKTDDYLKNMPKDMRNYLRRSVRKSQQVKIVRTVDPQPWIEEIYRLYLGQVDRSDLNLNGTQTKEYFANICRVDPTAHYVLCILDNQIIAFELFVQHGSRIISKLIGIDPVKGRENNVYFRTWMDLIQYCIENKITTIDLGCTHEALKVQLGANQLIPSVVMIKHVNPLINRILPRLKSFLNYESEVPVSTPKLGLGWYENTDALLKRQELIGSHR